jgi:hypothetical protein
VIDSSDQFVFASSDPQAALPAAGTLSGSATLGVTFKTPGNQTITVTDESTLAQTTSAAVVVSPPGQAPAMTTQPGNQTVTAESTVTFVAAASGVPMPTVQWQVSTNGGSSYQTITGATSSTYSFTAMVAQSGNLYEAVFTNATNSVTSNPASLTVNQASQAINAFGTVATQNYGEAPFAITLPTANDASGQPVVVAVKSGPASISGNTVTLTGAGTVVLAADQAGNTNYSVAPEVTTSFTVNPATLTYNATAASRAYGAANPTFTGTVTGFVSGDNQISATTGTLSFSSSANATSPIGNYAINGSGLSAANYIFQQASANATALGVTSTPLTITADNVSKVAGATLTFDGSGFTSSGLQNSERIGSVTLTSAGATSSAGTGVYPITANNATGGTFNPANYAITYVPGSLTVTAAIQGSTQTFSAWEAQYPTLTEGPTGTPEHDGVPNLLKYLFDINPILPMSATDRAALPAFTVNTSAGQTYLLLTYREYAEETGVTINVQTSPDLKTWTTLNITQNQYTLGQTGSSTGDSGISDPIMQIQVPASGTRQFLRLNVTQP